MRLKDYGSWLKHCGSWIKECRSRLKYFGFWLRDYGSTLKDCGFGLKHDGDRCGFSTLQAQQSGTGTGDASQPASLEVRLRSLINRAPVMLFMKGTPNEPQCGFSRQILELLKSVDAKFDSFDILKDEDVRQGEYKSEENKRSTSGSNNFLFVFRFWDSRQERMHSQSESLGGQPESRETPTEARSKHNLFNPLRYFITCPPRCFF
ncbi:unnamed protein product [Echinostoma caproni]|uniref:Glutaredoxin domain-containing protein n=1 Tax=Echinostoma caproni TaxID=27848 RepID=A0A3P8EX34_9TREM|nr:unnamed protein product [Echinostoma caproni]